MSSTFTDSFLEAWVFCSVLYSYSDDYVDLVSLLMMADYLNKTPILQEELERGVSLLLQREMLMSSGSRLRPTERAIDLGKRLNSQVSALAALQTFQQWFLTSPEEGESISWRVSQLEFRSAVSTAVNRAAQANREEKSRNQE